MTQHTSKMREGIQWALKVECNFSPAHFQQRLEVLSCPWLLFSLIHFLFWYFNFYSHHILIFYFFWRSTFYCFSFFLLFPFVSYFSGSFTAFLFLIKKGKEIWILSLLLFNAEQHLLKGMYVWYSITFVVFNFSFSRNLKIKELLY